MNDDILKKYDYYEQKFEEITKKVTYEVNVMWYNVLQCYYEDSFNENKKGKYFVAEPSELSLAVISPHARKLLRKMLIEDGFEYCQTAKSDVKWYITRENVDKIIGEYRAAKEEKNNHKK